MGRSLLAIPLLTQFLKYGIVGVSNTLLTYVTFTFLAEVLGVYYLAASAIGFIVGAVNGFVLNSRWTFKEHAGDLLTPVRWTIVQGCGLLADLGLLYLFVHDLDVDKLIGQAFAIGIVVVATFFVNRTWTFRTEPATQLG